MLNRVTELLRRQGVVRDAVRLSYGTIRTLLDSIRSRRLVSTRWSVREQRWHYSWPEGKAISEGRWKDAQGWATRGFYYGMDDLLWRDYRPGPGDVVLDLGAGNGGETFYLARMVGETGRVIAVEAAPGPYAELAGLVSLNGWRHVEPVHAAVTDTPGTVTIQDDESWVGSSIYAGSGVPVRATTIDDICADLGIDHVDWLKMNIEGAERDALRGWSGWPPRSGT